MWEEVRDDNSSLSASAVLFDLRPPCLGRAMLPSFLTTLFFSLSVIFAARSAQILGPGVANLARIILATLLLSVWAHLFGNGIRGPGFAWFFLSGIIGFG